MRKHRLLTALVCLALLTLGACLHLSAKGILSAEGVTVRRAELGAGRGTIFLPAANPAQSIPLWEEPAGADAGGHEDSVVVGGSLSAALILSDGGDGARTLAAEFARRGVAALIPDRDVPAAEAWNWLLSRDFTRRYAVGLMASERRADEALELAGALPEGQAAATVILLGGDSTLRRAGECRARNLLILTDRAPEPEAKSAFFGGGDPANDFTGYFSEGTARAVRTTQHRGFGFRAVLEQLMDWQGSSLGHAVARNDGDLIGARIVFCRAGTGFCLAAAALVWLLRRKNETA